MKKQNKKKTLIYIFICLVLLCAIDFLLVLHKDTLFFPTIKKVEISEYNKETNKVTLNVYINSKYLMQKDIYCTFNNKKVLAKNNKCKKELDLKNYKLNLLVDDKKVGKDILLSDNVNNIISIIPANKKVYLSKNEQSKIELDVISLTNKYKITYKSNDETIAKVDKKGNVTGLKEGNTKIVVTSGDKNIEIEVIVTSLISIPTLNNKKPFLPCKNYSNEEAKLMDELLAYNVNVAGKKTRAGVVAAARFLTLRFPYRLSYFLENGRLSDTYGGNYVDGEGRYYHEGLYLSKEKYSSIESSLAGPAMWGCPITEYLDNGVSRSWSNGLDCSGFVSWTLKNGGYDFGDLAAGSFSFGTEKDLTWLGDFVPITYDLLKSGKVKAGDLASTPGHISIIVGIDDNHVYIAEELWHSEGLWILTFTYDELVNSPDFDDIVLMDKAYERDGNYTNMWN